MLLFSPLQKKVDLLLWQVFHPSPTSCHWIVAQDSVWVVLNVLSLDIPPHFCRLAATGLVLANCLDLIQMYLQVGELNYVAIKQAILDYAKYIGPTLVNCKL